MANIKISQLPNLITVDPSDIFPIVQGGVTYSTAISNLSSTFLPLAGGTLSGVLNLSQGIKDNQIPTFTTVGTNVITTFSSITGGGVYQQAFGVPFSTPYTGITGNMVVAGTPTSISSNIGSLTNTGTVSPFPIAPCSLDFPNLVTIGGPNITTVLFNGSTALNFPSLVNVFCPFVIGSINLVTADFPSLQNIISPSSFGLRTVNSSNSLTSFTLPAIVNITGNGSGSIVLAASPNLVTFTLGATLKYVSNLVSCTSCALDQASVDNILIRLAALDGTNGTTIYSNLAVTILGTSSTPSSAGLAAASILTSRGCTVTTN